MTKPTIINSVNMLEPGSTYSGTYRTPFQTEAHEYFRVIRMASADEYLLHRGHNPPIPGWEHSYEVTTEV